MTPKKKDIVESVDTETSTPSQTVSPNDPEWTEHVLGMLNDDEKISGNPTTDGLRRVFEKCLNCDIIESTSEVVQSPCPENEKRATVVHRLAFYLKDDSIPEQSKYRSVSGAADVYWGNCDKIYRNHPVAVAETRAEGRALRRGLKLRKVVAAEEISKDIDDHPDENTVSKITNNQINFIDVMAKRLNINVSKLLEINHLEHKNIYLLGHEEAVSIVRLLSKFQQNIGDIPAETLGYNSEWK